MKNDFATKADLKKTADGLHQKIALVQEDLDLVKEDLVSVKKEIVSVRKDIECVAVQVVQVSNDLQEFKQETKSRFNGVMTAIDGLAGLITNGQTEKASVHHALLRHDQALGNHETRIGVLEENIQRK